MFHYWFLIILAEVVATLEIGEEVDLTLVSCLFDILHSLFISPFHISLFEDRRRKDRDRGHRH